MAQVCPGFALVRIVKLNEKFSYQCSWVSGQALANERSVMAELTCPCTQFGDCAIIPGTILVGPHAHTSPGV